MWFQIPTTASAVRSSGLPVPKKKLISSTVVPVCIVKIFCDVTKGNLA